MHYFFSELPYLFNDLTKYLHVLKIFRIFAAKIIRREYEYE